MKWIRERDALIAQTMAFVQSVTGRTNAPGRMETADPAQVSTVEVSTFVAIQETIEETVQQTVQIDEPAPAAPPPKPSQVAPPSGTGDFRSEVQSRVANFRKHQERFEREREEYCAATLAKLRAAIGDGPLRPPTGK